MNADGIEGPDDDPRLQESFNRYSEKLAEQARDISVDSGGRSAFNEQLLADLKPVRPLHPAAVFAVGFLIVSAVLVLAAIWSLGATGWHRLMLHQRISVLTSLFASAALLSFSLSRQMLPGARVFASPVLLLVASFVMVSLTLAGVFQIQNEVQFLRHGGGCVAVGLPFALLAALLFYLLLRRGATVCPKVTAASAGALAGLVSLGALEMHCPNLNLWHVLVFHGGFPIAGSLLGLLLSTLVSAFTRRS